MNLIEILKDAPKGLVLYTPTWGNVELVRILRKSNRIVIKSIENDDFQGDLDMYGKVSDLGECILYPSKIKRVWEGWQSTLLDFGIYATSSSNGFTYLIKSKVKEFDKINAFKDDGTYVRINCDDLRFSTKDEIVNFKTNLMNHNINLNISKGSITVDQFKLKFKIGDKVINKECNTERTIEGYNLSKDCYLTDRDDFIDFIDQDDWEFIDYEYCSDSELNILDLKKIQESILSNQWVSVEDKLPDAAGIDDPLSNDVFVYRGRGIYEVAKYDYESRSWSITGVTHWMDIPPIKQ